MLGVNGFAIIRALSMVPLLSACFACMAGEGFVKGQVSLIRTHDAATLANWAPPRFWFTLKGVTAAGGCGTWVTGEVLFASEDRQALSLIVSAQVADREVAVAYNDGILVNTYCKPTYITFGSSVPLQ